MIIFIFNLLYLYRIAFLLVCLHVFYCIETSLYV